MSGKGEALYRVTLNYYSGEWKNGNFAIKVY